MRFRVLSVVGLLLLGVVACDDGESASDDIETTDTRVLASAIIEQQIHYAGFTIDVVEVVHRPRRVTVNGTATNLGRVSTNPPLKVSLDDGSTAIDMEIGLSKVPVVPAQGSLEISYGFRVPSEYDLAAAVLRIGAEEFASAAVPLGSRGALITNAPITGFLSGTLDVGEVVYSFVGAELRFDDVSSYRQLAAGQALLRVDFSLTNEDADGPEGFGGGNVLLRTPDGEALTPTTVTSVQVPPSSTAEGLTAEWVVPFEPGTWAFVAQRPVAGGIREEEVTFEIPGLP